LVVGGSGGGEGGGTVRAGCERIISLLISKEKKRKWFLKTLVSEQKPE